MIDITTFGAIGDGTTMNTAAIQAALDQAAKTGAMVQIPDGVFLTGTLVLNGASLHLESGAVLKASGNMEDYPEQPYHHNEMGTLRAMLVNLGHDNVTIEGDGTIDFSGCAFYDMDAWNVPSGKVPFREEQIRECTHPIGTRPAQCLFFHASKNITIRNIRVIDAPCWTLTFSECENVKLTGLTIDTDLNIPNNDGIHICACKGVIISDCHISSGDDCIALTCITNWEKPCEDVVITNCVLRSCSKAIVIGYLYSVVRNVLISNCIIKESNRGFCIMCNDESSLVENVRISNMLIDTKIRAGNWWGNGEPIFMMAVKHDYDIPAEQFPQRKTESAIRNVQIENVTCMGENAMGIYGTGGNICEVVLRHIDYRRKPSANLALKGEVFDFSPGRIEFEVPADCGLFIGGNAETKLEDLRMHDWRIIEE
ncbi:MAG: hypothetical protein HDR21_00395 [Lachnospiraceae bacterium]|nr:hypothetical protein [Lachnospiraceae bacterium]